MSITVNYLPGADADRVIWLNNFAAKLAIYATLLGISAAEVTSMQKDAAYFQFIMNMLEAYKQTVNNITSYKNLLKKAVAQQHLPAVPTAPVLGTAPPAVAEGVFDRVSMLVKRMKASAGYTESMGQDLGIIAPVQTTDVSQLQPDLSVRLDAGRPHIKSNKGISDAIDLYVDRKDGSGWALIGRLIKPDYIDTTNLPANSVLVEWDYKAMFVIGNDQVGLMSPVVSVIVKRL